MEVTLCRTIKGNGYKIVVEGKWLYANADDLNKVVKGEAKACRFREIASKEKEAE